MPVHDKLLAAGLQTALIVVVWPTAIEGALTLIEQTGVALIGGGGLLTPGAVQLITISPAGFNDMLVLDEHTGLPFTETPPAACESDGTMIVPLIAVATSAARIERYLFFI